MFYFSFFLSWKSFHLPFKANCDPFWVFLPSIHHWSTNFKDKNYIFMEKDCMIWLKVSEQLLDRCCGEIILSAGDIKFTVTQNREKQEIVKIWEAGTGECLSISAWLKSEARVKNLFILYQMKTMSL